MKYIVTARSWDEELELQFGEHRTVHDLTESQVIQAIIKHGRVEIIPTQYDGTEILELNFQNEYD